MEGSGQCLCGSEEEGQQAGVPRKVSGVNLKVRATLREAEDVAWRAVTVCFSMGLGVMILYSMHLRNKVSSRRTKNEKDYC